jgi:hypothetical protein
MLFLRSLTFPIAALTFAALYVAARKAPQAVEFGSLTLCGVLILVIVAAAVSKRRKTPGL